MKTNQINIIGNGVRFNWNFKCLPIEIGVVDNLIPVIGVVVDVL